MTDFRGALRFSVLLLAACRAGDEEPEFPLDDGTSVPLPLACRVETAAPRPHRVSFTLRNQGTRPVFFAIGDGSCAVTASLSSCARGFKDDLFWHGGRVCPCSGSCPVGGPSCGPTGREMAPGGSERMEWQATITVLAKREGETCAAGDRNLPAGRYRITVPAFASMADATAAMPPLFTLSQDFELPAPSNTVDLPFTTP